MREEMQSIDLSFTERLRRYVEVAWRRRFFILVPLLASIPLSVIGSNLLPEKYIARTLLLFQKGNSNPLEFSDRYENPVIEVMEGLEALLKSQHILDSALKQIMGEDYPKTARQQALVRQDLADSISIIPIGRNFFEFRLMGSGPQGMGQKLEVVTSRFLESLLVADRAPASAAEMVLERRKLEMQQAVKAVEEFERETTRDQAGRNTPTKARQLEETAQRLEAKKQELKTVEFKIDKELTKTGDGLPDRRSRGSEIVAEPIRDWSPTSPMDKIAKLIKDLGAVRSTDDLTNSSEIAPAKKQPVDTSEIASLKAKRDWLRGEIGQLAANVHWIEASIAENERRIEIGKRLKRQLQEATANYNNYAKYADPVIVSSAGPLQVVASPGQIKVIDRPEDPEFPQWSRTTYIFAGILAGLALGCSAAIVAEILDQRLRHPEEFVAILGAPMICRLPNSHGIDDPPTDNVTRLWRADRRSEQTRGSDNATA